ncbi:MAG: hypothetical protein EZS28_056081, partial [Streblomastix strix]
EEQQQQARGYTRKLRKRAKDEEEQQEQPPEEEPKTPSAQLPKENVNGWAVDDKPAEPEKKVVVIDEVDNFAIALEDEEDITMQVAAAPAAQRQKLQTLQELDAQISQSKPLQMTYEGVNLSALLQS